MPFNVLRLTMMALGTYRFGVWNAAYQQFHRQNAWRWQAQKRIANTDRLQYTGRTPTSISLSGVIYPTFRGGLGQIDDMRAAAESATPLRLVTGTGQNFGRYIITSIEEKQDVFLPAGIPKRINFTITLQEYRL